MSVVVFGSVNMDLVARTPRLPQPGETLIGYGFETIPGGKGANQAVAVARLGIPVQMVGRVGQDAFGERLIAGLQADGVRCDRLFVDPDRPSGVALIAVDDTSENHIIVIPGANGAVGSADLDQLQGALSEAELLLLQLEVPLESVVIAAQQAQTAGCTVILDPAPAPDSLPDELYRAIDIITPNQAEATQLVGFPVTDWDSAAQTAAVLQQRGVPIVIIKLGKEGAFCLSPDGGFQVPAFPVDAVDTVAAGDAFNGGLAASLAEGLSLQQAVYQAAAIAALSVTQPGAQPSLPTREALEAFL